MIKIFKIISIIIFISFSFKSLFANDIGSIEANKLLIALVAQPLAQPPQPPQQPLPFQTLFVFSFIEVKRCF